MVLHPNYLTTEVQLLIPFLHMDCDDLGEVHSNWITKIVYHIIILLYYVDD